MRPDLMKLNAALRLTALLAVTAFLGACASGTQDGAEAGQAPQMFAVYNATLDNRDVRVCKRVATGTRVKKTVCLTQYQWDRVAEESREYLFRNEMELLQ